MPWAATPAPRALSTLQDIIQKFVLSPDDTEADTLATEALNDAVRELNSRNWPWTLTTENVTLVASTAAYVLTNGAARTVRHIHLLDSSDKPYVALPFMDPKTFELQYQDRRTDGSVECYTVHNMIADGTITLSCPPGAAFVAQYPKMQVRFYKRLLYYASAADTLTTLGGAPVEAENFLVWKASEYVGLRYLEGNDPKIVYARENADRIWRWMERDAAIEKDWTY